MVIIYAHRKCWICQPKFRYSPNYDIIQALSKDSTLTVFENVSAKPKEGAAVLSWNIDYDLYPLLEGKSLVVEYNTDIGAKRAEKGIEGSEWMYSEALTNSTTSFKLDELTGMKSTCLRWEYLKVLWNKL